MKTQLLALESHDDLISVKDKMSWAKTPRILLIWPKGEQVELRPLDLKMLQPSACRSLPPRVRLNRTCGLFPLNRSFAPLAAPICAICATSRGPPPITGRQIPSCAWVFLRWAFWQY
jgi:hypothetical protein